MLVRQVAQEGEDHKAREETGQRVDRAGDDGIPEKKRRSKIRKKVVLQKENVF